MVPRRLRDAWPQLRAGLVAAHACAIVLAAFPAPNGGAARLDDPNFLADVRPYARVFRTSDESFAAQMLAIRETWLEWRAPIVGPFEAYLDLVGAQQPWRMFTTANREPPRFVLEGHRAQQADPEKDWQFLSGLPAGDWQRSFFESERTRSFLNAVGRYDSTDQEDAFCRIVGSRALDENPDLAQVRCSFVHVPTTPMHAGIGLPDARISYRLVVGRAPR